MMQKEKIIYALGFFDGVHLGHRMLLQACRQFAGHTACKAGAVTFDTHPETLVAGRAPALLNTIEDRKQLIAAHGIDEILVLPFDEALRSMPWQAFLEMLLKRGAVGFICGDDFRFGYKGEGTADKLSEFCTAQKLYWTVVPAQTLGDTRISSTYIRQLVEQGEIELAGKFLGHPHILTGTVVPGKQLGRTIGIPTANLLLPPGILCPRFGVYACKALVEGQEYMAVTNIGTRPTVNGESVTVEPWLLDFDGDLYGRELTLEFHGFLRPEKKFESLASLKREIEKNAAETRKFFAKN